MAEEARFVKGIFFVSFSFVFHFHLEVLFHILTLSYYRRKHDADNRSTKGRIMGAAATLSHHLSYKVAREDS